MPEHPQHRADAPDHSMIEFKQIIGRGTRLYDGKDYFTIYDFVKAHHHFNDPEWDGEPIPPEPEPRDADAAPPCEQLPPQPKRSMRQTTMRLRARVRNAARGRACAEKGEGQAGRRQGADHPAHDGAHVLAP
jgi:superfamily II DNA or RNA helicase